MSEELIKGRGFFDFLVYLIEQYSYLVLVVIAAIFFGSWFFIHKNADIGDEVVIWGLFKYTKRKKSTPVRYRIYLIIASILLGAWGIFYWLPVNIFRKSQNIPKEGLVAYWSFDRCDAKDQTNNGHDGTIFGEPECINGVQEKAFRFDGHDAYIVVENTSVLNPTTQISILAWYKPLQSFAGDGTNVIIQKPYTSHTAPYYQYLLGIRGDTYRQSISQGIFKSTFSVNDKSIGPSTEHYFWRIGHWYFLAAVYDGQYIKMFVNGTLIGQVLKQGTLSRYDTPVMIGKHYNLHRQIDYTVGAIDEVRIYNRAISETEIQALYNLQG